MFDLLIKRQIITISLTSRCLPWLLHFTVDSILNSTQFHPELEQTNAGKVENSGGSSYHGALDEAPLCMQPTFLFSCAPEGVISIIYLTTTVFSFPLKLT